MYSAHSGAAVTEGVKLLDAGPASPGLQHLPLRGAAGREALAGSALFYLRCVRIAGPDPPDFTARPRGVFSYIPPGTIGPYIASIPIPLRVFSSSVGLHAYNFLGDFYFCALAWIRSRQRDGYSCVLKGDAVGFRLTPHDTSFFDILSDAATHLVTGSQLLVQIVNADTADRQDLAAKLHEVENQADACTHALFQKLNQTFVTPLDRDDLYVLASTIDDCMDYMDEAGDLIMLYKVGKLPRHIVEQVEVLQRCSELTADAMPRLRSMESLRNYWVEINRLENEADRAYRRAIAELFEREDNALRIIKLKDITIALERGVDAFERLANTIETIVVKES